MLYHDMLFSALLPQYQLRHLVKPGITGLAQSAGYHGATAVFFSISNRTRLDLFYVKRMSLGLDVKILLTTLFIVPVKCIKRLYAGSNGH
jgi:lipopolysaccharide/colanic/teichoic acid biosynthesis glycosyltransferase